MRGSECLLGKPVICRGWVPNLLPLEYSDRYAIRGTLESNPAERRRMSKKFNLDAMSIDEMWQLHEEINAVLSIRLTSEKRELEKRLAQLRREKEMRQSEAPDGQAKDAPRERRKYPRV